MGVQKVVSFLFTSFFLIGMLTATVVAAVVAYRRRRERGLAFLMAALALQLIDSILFQVAYSPARLAPQEVVNILKTFTAYAPRVAMLLGLIGWIVLARDGNQKQAREAAQPGATDNLDSAGT